MKRITCILAIGTSVSFVRPVRIFVNVTLSLFFISWSNKRAWKLFYGYFELSLSATSFVHFLTKSGLILKIYNPAISAALDIG
jgi:hypothetical protein